jgi:hypothetical protein
MLLVDCLQRFLRGVATLGVLEVDRKKATNPKVDGFQ